MTTELALDIVNKARGFVVPMNDLPYSESTREAVNDIEAIATMVENQGGILRSRQVISTIIYLAEKRVSERP